MSDKSAIEWTDATWNPTRGCVKVSPGCKHCYAETFAERWRGVPGHPYEQGFDPTLVPHKVGEPLRWRRPRRVFVDSMSDIFGEWVPDQYVATVFGVMAVARQHTFQLLTKRADRLPVWFAWAAAQRYGDGQVDGDPISALARGLSEHPGELPGIEADDEGVSMSRALDVEFPLPNVWLGVSVEDRRYGLPRIEHLRAVPAAVRFLSIEPLLEDLGEIDLRGIGWVIAGGESGLGARPMRPEWVRSIRDQCAAASVPFFDGRTHDEFPGRQAA